MLGFWPISDRGVFPTVCDHLIVWYRGYDHYFSCLHTGHFIFSSSKNYLVIIHQHHPSSIQLAEIRQCTIVRCFITWIAWISGTFAGVTFCSNFLQCNFVLCEFFFGNRRNPNPISGIGVSSTRVKWMKIQKSQSKMGKRSGKGNQMRETMKRRLAAEHWAVLCQLFC